MKRVLIIAYYFPPMGLGGVQRVLKLARYLPEFGWEPTVVTVKDVLYYARDDTLLDEIPDTKVIRTGSLDPQRVLWKLKGSAVRTRPITGHLKSNTFFEIINRKLLPWFLVPDPKVLWLPFARRKVLQILKSNNIDLLFTTSPPQSVHLLGKSIKTKTGLPWVADFRDNWLEEAYENVPTILHRKWNRHLAKGVFKSADRILSVSEPITQDFVQRSIKNSEAIITLPNGFDRDDFPDDRETQSDKFTISYHGALYKHRSPEIFFNGLQKALENEPSLKKKLHVRFVGPTYGFDFDSMVKRFGLSPVVEHIPYLPHKQNIEMMMKANLLLLIISNQSSEGIITSKIFEYLATGKPILAMIPRGEAEKLIIKHARGAVIHPGHVDGVSKEIIRSFSLWERGLLKVTAPRWQGLESYDRKQLTARLADVFNSLIQERPK